LFLSGSLFGAARAGFVFFSLPAPFWLLQVDGSSLQEEQQEPAAGLVDVDSALSSSAQVRLPSSSYFALRGR
jgi:hypothetical protein